MAEMNRKRQQMQIQSLMSLGAAAINLLSTISSFLLILKVRLQTNALVATYLTKRESFWKKKFRKSQERKTSRKRRSVWYVRGRTGRWWDNMVSGVLPEDNWKKNFRMSRELFDQLVNALNPWIRPILIPPTIELFLPIRKLVLLFTT